MSDDRLDVELEAPAPGGLTTGKVAVLATLSLFVIVPLITIGSYRLMEGSWTPTDQMMRDLEIRADGRPAFLEKLEVWHEAAVDVKETTLRRGTVSSARNDQVFKELPFDISAEEEALVRATARIAQQPYLEGREVMEADRIALRLLMAEKGEHFYPLMVLAMWEQTPEASIKAQAAIDRGEGYREAFWDLYERAYERSPSVITLTQGPVARSYPPQQSIQPKAFVFDRVRRDVVDSSLVLWYPRAPRIYLFGVAYPVYKSLFRLRDPRIPVSEADTFDPERPPAWFVYPGDVGRMPYRVSEISQGYDWDEDR
ncbi:MAG: hypothetical protein RLN76_01365 [Phycisphaeraceae bacterium]